MRIANTAVSGAEMNLKRRAIDKIKTMLKIYRALDAKNISIPGNPGSGSIEKMDIIELTSTRLLKESF